jgi:hypothetical protein
LLEQEDAHTGVFSSEPFLGVITNRMLSRLSLARVAKWNDTSGAWPGLLSAKRTPDCQLEQRGRLFDQSQQGGVEHREPGDWCRACYDNGVARTFCPCHRLRHQAPLTPRQFQENERMKATRITVEWSHTQVKALWAVADNHKNKFKLETDHHLIFAQIRLARLFSNCVTCRRGNQTSTCFGLDAPSLDQHLSMVL